MSQSQHHLLIAVSCMITLWMKEPIGRISASLEVWTVKAAERWNGRPAHGLIRRPSLVAHGWDQVLALSASVVC